MLKDDIVFYKEKGYLKYPKILQIEITKRCPLECPQCYKDLEGNLDIDFDFLSNFLKEEAKNGLKSVMLNGGEPLIYKHFMELLRIMHRSGIKSNVFTSGYNLTDEIMKCIRETNTFFNISLNGSTEEINATSRDGYAIAMKAIQKLSVGSADYGINWVARHDNVMDFPNIVAIAEEFNANNILIVGNKKNHKGVLQEPLTKEDYLFLKEYIGKHNKKESKVKIIVQTCFTSLNYILTPSVKDRLNKGCPSGITFCSMTVDGLFMPCTHIYRLEKFDSVSSYWHQSKTLMEFRQFDKSSGLCIHCSAWDNCQFCRATSKAAYDDFTKGLEECEVYETLQCDTRKQV